MIRCLVVDDEPLAIQVLEKYISETPGLVLAHKCRNAIEAFELLKQDTIDLMFLDIEMPLVNGIDLLKTVKIPPKTVFTTAYREYAFEGYELSVVDYLLKPFSFERFLTAIEKFKDQFETGTAPADRFLLVKDRQGLIKVPYSDILHIESCKDYVKVLTAAQNFMVLKTMKEMAQELGDSFIRVHRSYIVPARHIKAVKTDTVVLANGEDIPLGNLYRKEVLDFFAGK